MSEPWLGNLPPGPRRGARHRRATGRHNVPTLRIGRPPVARPSGRHSRVVDREQPTEFMPRVDVITPVHERAEELFTHRTPLDDDTEGESRRPRLNSTTVVRTLSELFITAGLVVLLFAFYEVYWTDLISSGKQNQATSDLDDLWKNQRGTHFDLTDGKGFAKLYIPALGPDNHYTVIEGADPDDLDIGPGHYKGTALPGEPGNVSIAGHRVGKGNPFNDLDLVSSCDAIVVETASDWYVYRLLPLAGETAGWSTSAKGSQDKCKALGGLSGPYAGLVGQETVLPTEGDVIAPVPHHDGLVLPPDQMAKLLTLTTCTPKFYSTHRLILHALLTKHYTKDPAHPTPPPELKETD
ncbi:MAG: class E sortase [Kutzneria sp.]|nr:class E sortase [Kutzneria sp.]